MSWQASGLGEDRQVDDARGTWREGKRQARCFNGVGFPAVFCLLPACCWALLVVTI